MFVEDLMPFLADFGQPVTFTGLGRQVTAIFDDGFRLADVGSAGMATSQPTLTLRTEDVPPQIIDWLRYYAEPFDPVNLQVSFTVNTVPKVYTIAAHEPNGTGLSRLLLEST